MFGGGAHYLWQRGSEAAPRASCSRWRGPVLTLGAWGRGRRGLPVSSGPALGKACRPPLRPLPRARQPRPGS